MKRGEVWWVNFEPSIGGEIRRKRPAIIVSNNAANKYLNRVQVVPLTSDTDRVYPSEAIVVIDGREGKAMADSWPQSVSWVFPRELVLSQVRIWRSWGKR